MYLRQRHECRRPLDIENLDALLYVINGVGRRIVACPGARIGSFGGVSCRKRQGKGVNVGSVKPTDEHSRISSRPM